MLGKLLVGCTVFLSFSAHALTVGDFKKMQSYKENETYKSYMLGLQRGIVYTDFMNERINGNGMICISSDADIAEIDYEGLALKAIKEDGIDDDQLLEMVMISALIAEYPCS